MAYQIIRKLNKAAHPDGYINFKFINRRAGVKDYKNFQLCIQDDKYQTPWLAERIRCLAEYDNKIYCRVDESLEPVAHSIASECKELERLAPEKIPAALDRENQERLTAAFDARVIALEKRRSDILIHLAELKMDIETIDAALQHHLQRAENVVMKHVSAYWGGVLKAAASDDMPPKPDVDIPDIPGRAVYETHVEHIRNRLDRVLAENNVEEV